MPNIGRAPDTNIQDNVPAGRLEVTPVVVYLPLSRQREGQCTDLGGTVNDASARLDFLAQLGRHFGDGRSEMQYNSGLKVAGSDITLNLS